MAITGDIDPRRLLSSNLDFHSLMMLCRDILYVRGHRQICITNGPGDGQRDLHSISEDGLPFITQCKFHQDVERACSSRELGDLPLALLKMNATGGLFLTNARISPQAKKEFLNDYPSLKLEFLDGDELVTTVLDHPILKAVWFDGNEVKRDGMTAAFPVIVRRHGDDHPINGLQRSEDLSLLVGYLMAKWASLDFKVRYSKRNVEAFRPYRPPINPTVEEGLSNWIYVTEVLADGPYSMADLELLSLDISRAFVSCLSQNELSATVVVGKPHLASMSSESLGAFLDADFANSNYLFNRSLCILEEDFFSVDQEEDLWLVANDARVSEADWIRLYSRQLDCALAYDLNFTQTTQIDRAKIYLLATTRRGWQASVHALLPRWDDEWPYPDIEPPDERIDWPWSSQTICAWFHWTILGEYAVKCPSWSDKRSSKELEIENLSVERLAKIRRVLSGSADAELLTPDKARYMIATVGVDVLAEPLHLRYSTAEIIHFFGNCRSPLLPQNRTFLATVVWPKLFDCARLESVAAKCLDADTIFRCYEDGEYIVAELCFDFEGISEVPSYLILRKLHLLIAKSIGRFEVSEEDSRFSEIVTWQYWKEKFNISLGINHVQSTKKYIGFSPEEVGISTSPKIIFD